jgi:hypothetical protein
MATTAKKPPAPPVEEVQTAAPAQESIPVTLEPEPVQVTVTGHSPLTDDQARRVNTIKEHFQDTVKYLQVLRDAYHAQAVLDDLDIAITHAETASMWAVRAVTKAV